MRKNLVRTRAYSTMVLMLMGAVLLLIQPHGEGSASVTAAPQGKGGAIKPVPTPTPAPKKATPKKTTTPAPRANTRSNPNAQPKVDEEAATERTYWETIRNSTDMEDFRAYLKKYPNGQFADLANNRIRALEAAAKPQPTPTPTPTPAPTPEIAYEWTKAERDLPAPVRVEWREKTDSRGELNLSFSVPSGWTRARREEGRHYLQLSFRAPDSPLTNISIQLYNAGVPHTLRNNSAEVYRNANEFIAERRKEYASQTVSAKLTDTEVINHPTGRWQTFTADFLDASVWYIFWKLDAVYPNDIWETKYPVGGRSYEDLKLSSLSALTRTRHSYAIRQAGSSNTIIVVLYTAPIEKFDEKMLPSVMATLKMSNGSIAIEPKSSDSAVGYGLQKYDLEILIDGERKDLVKTNLYHRIPVSVGKHRVTVRAKEHKTFEKDVSVGGWEELELKVTLERITNNTSGATPK